AVTALAVARRAQRAEQENPAAGRFIDIDGVHLHYVERGQGPLWCFCMAMARWCRISKSRLDNLACQGISRCRVRPPGFWSYGSPWNRVWGPEAQSELFWHAMRRLGLDHAAVIGHSWGTMVALALALRHPESVRGLVLLSGY